jgi:hypothetical protein
MPIISAIAGGPRLTGVGRNGDDVAHPGDTVVVGLLVCQSVWDTLWDEMGQ